MILSLGLLLVVASLCCVLYLVLVPTVPKVALNRRRPGALEDKPLITTIADGLTTGVDGILKRRGWAPFTNEELEKASIKMTAGSLVVFISATGFALVVLSWAVSGNIFLGLVLGALVPVGAKLFLLRRAEKRCEAFAEGLDASIQLMASALRAGHSLPRAMDTVAQDSEPPLSEEFARIVNENRIGRDLVESMSATAERMKSADFQWVAEAVAVQRETGGNLNEVLDRVGNTIRERNQIRREVHSLSAEGRLSAIVLMALPPFTAVGMALVNPGYMDPLFHGSTGWIVLSVSAILFALGGLWMRIIVNIKV